MKAKALGKILIVGSMLLFSIGTVKAQFVFQNYLKPSSSTFQIVNQDHIKGGYHVVDSWAQLNDGSDIDGLHKSKREVGMIVVVLDQGRTYVLVSLGLNLESTADDVWQEVISTTIYSPGIPYKEGFMAIHEGNLYICTVDFTGAYPPAVPEFFVGQPLPSSNWVNLGGASGGDFAEKDFSNVEARSVVDSLIADAAISTRTIANFAVTTDKLSSNAVTGAKLNNSIAGSGLDFDGSHNLMVAVDSATIVFKNDTITVANGGLQAEKLRSNVGAALPNGAAGQVLSSDGSGNFQWLNSSSLSVDPSNIALGNDSIYVGNSSTATQMIVGGDVALTVYNGDSAAFEIQDDKVGTDELDLANISIADFAAANSTVDLNGNKIVNVQNATDSDDAANFYTVKKQINDSLISRLDDNSSSYSQWWSAGKMVDTLADYPVIYSSGKIDGAVLPAITINTTFVVDSLDQILVLDATIDTIVHQGDIVIDTTYSSSYMYIGHDDVDNAKDTLKYGHHVDTLSVPRKYWVPISFGNVISVNGKQGVVQIDLPSMPLTQAAISLKENDLGDPTTNGEVLTSNTSGVRTWSTVGNLLGGVTMDNLSDVTNYAAADDSTILVYDGSSWQAVQLTGDVTVGDAGIMTIGADAVELGANTTGNYVRSINDLGADGLKVTGNGEGGDISIQLNVDDSTLTIINDTIRLKNGAVRAGNLKAVSGSLGNGTDGQVLSADGNGGFEWMNASALSVNPNNITLDSASLLIGNASDLAQAQALSGAATIDHNGVLSLTNNAVTITKVAANAIDSTKIVDGSVSSADIKNGTITYHDIADDGITAAKIDASIAGDGLKRSAGDNSLYISTDNSTVQVVGDVLEVKDNAITSTKIADRGISGVDINQLGASAYQQLTWDGSNWVARTDSAIYVGFQDTIGLGATDVQRAIEAVNRTANASTNAVYTKIAEDSTAIWDKIYNDSIATVAVLSAQRSLLFAKLAFDSTYYEAQMDQDSLYFEGQLDADSTYFAGQISSGTAGLLSKMSTDSTYFENALDADSTAIWDKIYNDSIATVAVLSAQRSLLFAKLAFDSTYYEAQMDQDSLYFEGQLDADSTYFAGQISSGTAGLLSKMSTDSTYFENALDADSTALQNELNTTQTGAGLNIDGTYSANNLSTYIKTSTSLVDADNDLDVALSNLESNFTDTMIWTVDTITQLSNAIVSMSNDSANIIQYVNDTVAGTLTYVDDTVAGTLTYVNDSLLGVVAYVNDSVAALRLDIDNVTAQSSDLQSDFNDTTLWMVDTVRTLGADITLLESNFNDTMLWTVDTITQLSNAIVSMSNDSANIIQYVNDTIAGTLTYVDDTVAGTLVYVNDTLAGTLSYVNDSIIGVIAYVDDSVAALRADLMAFDALPTQTGSANLYLTTDGTTASWDSLRNVAIARGTITANKLSTNTDYLQNGTAGQVLSSSGNGNFYWQDASSLSVNASSLTLPNGQMYVGNGSDKAEAQDIIGDMSVNSSGVVTLNDTINSIAVLTVSDTIGTAQLAVSDSAVFSGAVLIGGTGVKGITTLVSVAADNDSLITAGAVKTYVDAVATAAGSVQSELDATQSGAGLGTGGAYSANGSATYISGATSLVNADDLLDAAIKVNSDSVSSYDTRLLALLDSSVVYRDSINAHSDSIAALRADLTGLNPLPDQTTAANQMLFSNGTNASWKLIDSTNITNAGISIADIKEGDANQLLSTNAAGDALEWIDRNTVGKPIEGGAGLTITSLSDSDSIAVNVDVTQLEITDDTIRIKDGGVSTAQIADGAVTSVKTSVSFPSVISGNTTLTANQQGVVLVNTSGGDVTVTLPVANTAAGFTYTLKNTGANTLTIDGNGAETIDGVATADIISQFGFITVVTDGSAWYKVAEYLPTYFQNVTPGLVEANKAVVVDNNRDITNFRRLAIENTGANENDAFYWGNPDVDGTWRATRTAAGLKFEKRVSGSWEYMMEIE